VSPDRAQACIAAMRAAAVEASIIGIVTDEHAITFRR
jgi:hypothetical protein